MTKEKNANPTPSPSPAPTSSPAPDQPESNPIRSFVSRMYTVALGRAAEEAGLNDWTGWIVRGEQTPESAAKLFFFSDEYQNKHTSDEEFVETLYQTFMDRASDSAGKADWLGHLAGGMSREEVLEGFSAAICVTSSPSYTTKGSRNEPPGCA